MSRRLFVGCGQPPWAQVMTPRNPLPEPVTEVGIDMLPLKVGNSVQHDLENYPWPLVGGDYDEVHAYEVLEHLGMQGDWRSFFRSFNELWRILKPGGNLYASTPTWSSLWAWGDPGHTRIINEGTIAFLSMRDIKPPASDYRSVIAGFWNSEGAQHIGERFFFHMSKAEENKEYEGGDR